MRAFQELTREEIRDRISGLAAEANRVRRLREQAEAERPAKMAAARTSTEKNSVRIQSADFSRRCSETATACFEEIAELEFEIHIRDTPELLAQFGPGKD